MGCPSRLRHIWEVQYSPPTDALSPCMRSQGAAERSAQCRVARAVRHLESAGLEKTESVRNIAPGGVCACRTYWPHLIAQTVCPGLI